MRLIDADELKKKFDRPFWEQDLASIYHTINNAPTVEPQKAVTIPHELIEKLVLCVVDTVESIDWNKAIEAYKEKPQSKWIPVSERLPDVSLRYLVYTKYDEVMTDFFIGDEFMQGDDVIAWMPLPEGYKKGGAE